VLLREREIQKIKFFIIIHSPAPIIIIFIPSRADRQLSSVCSTTFIRLPVGTGKTKALRGILNSLAGNRENLPCFIWVSYRKTLTNETKAKIEILQNLGLRVCQYQEVEGS